MISTFSLKLKTVQNYLKFMLMGIFNKRGYDFRIEKKSIIFLKIDDILESPYYTNSAFQSKSEILIDLPINKARSLSGDNFFNLSKHHSVLALENYIDKGETRDIETHLFDFYIKNTIPKNKLVKNLNDIYGIDLKKLRHVPSWLTLLPWNNDNIKKLDDIMTLTDMSTYIENAKRGIGISASQGGSQFVFTAEKRARLEAKLISKLYKSITHKGFDERENLKDPIGAVLFIDDDKYAWLISGGIHRMCVLIAMKQESIVVRLKKVIYKKDLKYWPNVKNGLFLENEASLIFDKIIGR